MAFNQITKKQGLMKGFFAHHKPILYLLIVLLAMTSCKDQQTEAKTVVEAKENVVKNKKAEPKPTGKKILFFGDSLTEGYGLEASQSFPSIIQEKINKQGLDYIVVNGGVSGETTTGGSDRINWVLRQAIDIFVLELGANDMLRGYDLDSSEKNLRSILDKVKDKYPTIPIVIAGMQAPTNMGATYVNKFNNLFPSLAKDYNATLIPFLLAGVAADPALNQADGVHPNVEGTKIVAENVWEVLKGIL